MSTRKKEFGGNMGNVTERDGSLSADIEDGEIMYDTIARDFAYKRCTSKSEENKFSRKRSGIARSTRRAGPARSISRTKKSIKRSLSMKRTSRKTKNPTFTLSDMEVKVDGKVAK